MNTFKLQIVTLDGVSYDDEAVSVVARVTTGDVCILKNHAAFVAPIEVGKVKIKNANGEEFDAACAGGFISVNNNNVRIVATTFEFSYEIDIRRAEKAKEQAENLIETKRGQHELSVAELKLKKALLRLNISKKD